MGIQQFCNRVAKRNIYLCNVIKKKVYISCIWLATLLMLSTAFLPHHHHLKMLCFTQEKCQIDSRVNDQHTTHQTTGSERGCAIEQIKQAFTTEKDLHQSDQYLLQEICLLYSVLSALIYFRANNSSLRKFLRHPIILLHDGWIESRGLRAPPTLYSIIFSGSVQILSVDVAYNYTIFC